MTRAVQPPPGIRWASDILLGRREFPTIKNEPESGDEFEKILKKELDRLNTENRERTDTK